MDIRKTIEMLSASEIRVHCLALGGVDLTTPAGKMTIQVISAVAESEQDLLPQRTHACIALAKASGKRFGRPRALDYEQKKVVLLRLSERKSFSSNPRELTL